MDKPKLLFAGQLDHGGTTLHRIKALGRLGYETIPFNFGDYIGGHNKLANWLYHRLLLGPAIDRLNADLLELAESTRPAFVLVDKGIFVRPATVRRISASVAPIIHYNPDNPFGQMRLPGWEGFRKAIPLYDAHLVPRQSSVEDLKSVGAKCAVLMPFAYEPSIHYPPPLSWGEAERTIDVSFTGTPHENRAQFMTTLLEDHGIAVDIRGTRWSQKLKPSIAERIYKGGPVYDDGYRERFWRSKICLAFVTHTNLDQVAHKSFEIAASGGFLLAEATKEHRKTFEDGKEAVFFSDAADCARLIKAYLPDRASRERISAAGYRRAMESGYSNDAMLERALNLIAPRDGT